ARDHAAEAAATGGAFLLVRDLAAARELVEAGAEVAVFNIGGLHYAPGKDKVHESVYLDAGDRDAARALLAHGVALVVRDVPAAWSAPGWRCCWPRSRSSRSRATAASCSG